MASEDSVQPKLVQGAIYVALCYLFLALFGACAKACTDTVSTFTVLFFQNSICFLLNLPRALKDGIRTEHPFVHLTRSVCGFSGYFFFVLSVNYIPLANAVLLSNSGPLWIPFVIWVWFKRKVPSYLWGPLLVGFVSLVFILKPNSEIVQVDSLYGLISGVLIGIAIVAIRRLALTEPSSRILFYYFLLGSVVSFPGAIKDFSIVFSSQVVLFLGAAALSFYLVQIFITMGFKRGKASTLAPLSYLTVLFSAILDRIFWHRVPDLWSLTGMILIVAAGVASVYFEKKNESPLAQGNV
ncbi:MAG: DMT family transporter [Chlamydiota bacterium]